MTTLLFSASFNAFINSLSQSKCVWSCICVEEASLKPGGYSWEFLVGMCRQVLRILTLFQTKQCHFPHPFSDQTAKIHTRLQTWPGWKLCHHYLD